MCDDVDRNKGVASKIIVSSPQKGICLYKVNNRDTCTRKQDASEVFKKKHLNSIKSHGY